MKAIQTITGETIIGHVVKEDNNFITIEIPTMLDRNQPGGRQQINKNHIVKISDTYFTMD